MPVIISISYSNTHNSKTARIWLGCSSLLTSTTTSTTTHNGCYIGNGCVYTKCACICLWRPSFFNHAHRVLMAAYWAYISVVVCTSLLRIELKLQRCMCICVVEAVQLKENSSSFLESSNCCNESFELYSVWYLRNYRKSQVFLCEIAILQQIIWQSPA